MIFTLAFKMQSFADSVHEVNADSASYIDRYNKYVKFVYTIEYFIGYGDTIELPNNYENATLYDFIQYADNNEHRDIVSRFFDEHCYPYNNYQHIKSNYINYVYKNYSYEDYEATQTFLFSDETDEELRDNDIERYNRIRSILIDMGHANRNHEFDTEEYKAFYKYIRLCEFMYLYSMYMDLEYDKGLIFTNEDKCKMCENFIENVDQYEHEDQINSELDNKYMTL